MFQLQQKPPVAYEFDTETMLDVTIERDRDVTIVTRRGYYLPEILAEIGGIIVILVYTCSFLLGLWTNKYLERYMVSKLFRVKKARDSEDQENLKQQT